MGKCESVSAYLVLIYFDSTKKDSRSESILVA